MDNKVLAERIINAFGEANNICIGLKGGRRNAIIVIEEVLNKELSQKSTQNKYEMEGLMKNKWTQAIFNSAEAGDFLITVNEPDQNMLNFLSAKGYQLASTSQCGYMDESNGMSYNCIFRQRLEFPNYEVQMKLYESLRYNAKGTETGRFDTNKENQSNEPKGKGDGTELGDE